MRRESSSSTFCTIDKELSIKRVFVNEDVFFNEVPKNVFSSTFLLLIAEVTLYNLHLCLHVYININMDLTSLELVDDLLQR